MNGTKARLIYSASKLDFKETVELVQRNASAAGIDLEIVDADKITSNDRKRFLDDIRAIPPQIHGQIKSGGGRTLPISGSTQLNRSIPILIIYDGSNPIDVYPKDLRGIKHDLSSAFKPKSPAEALGVEHNINTILASKPEMLGLGVQLAHREFDTGSGVIDMVFTDTHGLPLIVEIKEEADQETVGQILKQSNGFKDKTRSTSVRKAIVALRISGNVRAACKDAEVELYLMTVEKQA